MEVRSFNMDVFHWSRKTGVVETRICFCNGELLSGESKQTTLGHFTKEDREIVDDLTQFAIEQFDKKKNKRIEWIYTRD